MKDQAADSRSPIIGWALVLTVLLLGVFAALLSIGRLPEGCTSGLWLIDRLGCLEPNALGDTFAGAFAPVAFVWLVTAVLLQRNELAAQRQELRESREVAEAQVAEAKNNVAFMAEQTKLLQAREDSERRQGLDDRFREHVEALNDYMESAFTKISVRTDTEDGFGNVMREEILSLGASDSQDIWKRLQRYSSSIRKLSIEAFRTDSLKRPLHYTGAEELLRIAAYLEELIRLSDTVSDALQIRFQIVEADDAVMRACNLAELLKARATPIPEVDW